ncbi:MAG: ABC transporter ATP-binding protein [Actinomycetota bacterium]
MSRAAVEVEGATVRFGAVVALDHVDLSVRRGEVVAVLGPSGSGKSTLLRAIAGLQPLDGGTIALGGRNMEGVPPHKRGVGLMFQDHALFPHRDVAGNIAFGLRMQRRPQSQTLERVERLLEMVDLEGFGRRRVQSLSGGEQQRVALARALAPEPAVLLLDEPLGALDRTLRDHLVAELRALFSTLGLTVVAVTHDQNEAFSLADRVAVMDAGSVLQSGAPADLWERPRSKRVARLLGFANLIDVQVVGGRANTPWGELRLAVPDGPATALIRPAGISLDAPGGVGATAVATTFLGDRTTVKVAVDGAPPLEALVSTGSAPGPGQHVTVAIDPAAVVPLAPSGP